MSEPSPVELTESQRRILAAAEAVFAERGYSGAATSEIARRAGVAEGTIFKHFKTKKDLLLGVVAPLALRVVAPVMAREFEKVLSAEYEDPETFLRAALKDRLALARRHRGMLRVVLQEMPFHEELRLLFRTNVLTRVLPPAVAAFARFQKRGLLVGIPAERIPALVAGMFASYVIPNVILGDGDARDDGPAIDLIVRVLIDGLRPRRPTGALPTAKRRSATRRVRATKKR